jgi:hypothetical protein
MASNLQVKNVLSATAQSVMDQNGKTSPLTVSTNVVGIGTAAPASKLHVVSAPSDPPPRLQSTPGGQAVSPPAGISIPGESGKAMSEYLMRAPGLAQGSCCCSEGRGPRPRFGQEQVEVSR